MSKRKLAGVIVACVLIIVLVIVVAVPSLAPTTEPAEFRVSALRVSPAEAEPGETVTISVDVRNVGDEAGSYDLNLVIDGLAEHCENVELASGEATTVRFSVRRETARIYAVEVDGLSGSFTIIIAATRVGGIIHQDTTWTEKDSPYQIIETVQIPHGVTLTIEPGVVVRSTSVRVMFLLNGNIYARGTPDSKILFDGGGHSSFFAAENRNPYMDPAFADLKYCIIRNGGPFWPAYGRGYFWLRHSEISDVYGESWIWYEHEDVYIEFNRFAGFGGFRVNNSGRVYADLPPATVHIRHNLFDGKSENYLVFNEVSDGGSVIVSYNSFTKLTGLVLRQGNYTSPSMSAPHNYWGTMDTESIEAMIYDRSDDINCPGYITYLPILTDPHSDTPSP